MPKPDEGGMVLIKHAIDKLRQTIRTDRFSGYFIMGNSAYLPLE
jgi:hypothetical protein